MKKQYIIPKVEVIEVKSNQLLMTSTMPVYSTDELQTPEDIL